jgi:hypothetical protein
MSLLRWLPVGGALILSTVVSGCAGAGPDLKGPEGPSVMAAYSGEWILVPTASDNLNAKVRDAMRGPGAGGGAMGGRPGGGGAGLPGEGGLGGRRGGSGMGGGMSGNGVDPEQMRQSMDAMRRMAQVPAEISLALQPETVALTEDSGSVLILTLGVEKERTVQGGVILLGSAKWTKDGIEIKRETEMGPGVKDKISLDETGRLIIKRDVDLMGRSVDGTLVYQRKSG